MNSDTERAIFEAHQWRYDYVQRVWIAPDGSRVTTDDLMIAADALGPQVERHIRRVAARHGRVAG